MFSSHFLELAGSGEPDISVDLGFCVVKEALHVHGSFTQHFTALGPLGVVDKYLEIGRVGQEDGSDYSDDARNH